MQAVRTRQPPHQTMNKLTLFGKFMKDTLKTMEPQPHNPNAPRNVAVYCHSEFSPIKKNRQIIERNMGHVRPRKLQGGERGPMQLAMTRLGRPDLKLLATPSRH